MFKSLIESIKIVFSREVQFQKTTNGCYEYFSVPRKWLKEYIYNRHAIGNYPRANYLDTYDFIMNVSPRHLAELEKQAKQKGVYHRIG